MAIITEKIDNNIKKRNLSRYKISKLLNYKESTLNRIINGKQSFSKALVEKLLPILEVSKEEFESWIIADKYSKEVIYKAIEAFKNRENNKTLVLTQNIDRILKEKNLSQTALSKLIKHSQSALNCALTGKEPLSKNVMKKLSEFFEIQEESLQAWILADKYPLKVLELALKL
jgi:plasmid maintenance system antidote protein VapI